MQDKKEHETVLFIQFFLQDISSFARMQNSYTFSTRLNYQIFHKAELRTPKLCRCRSLWHLLNAGLEVFGQYGYWVKNHIMSDYFVLSKTNKL